MVRTEHEWYGLYYSTNNRVQNMINERRSTVFWLRFIYQLQFQGPIGSCRGCFTSLTKDIHLLDLALGGREVVKIDKSGAKGGGGVVCINFNNT